MTSSNPAPAYEPSVFSSEISESVQTSPSEQTDDVCDPQAISYLRPPVRPPLYSFTVFHSGAVNRKLEFVEPGVRSSSRCWHAVYLIILGTFLKVYEIAYAKANRSRYVLKTATQYTLQYAESGIAEDYYKRRFVIRVRAEGHQFLLQCRSDSERDTLLEAIQAASNIALDLDTRQLPETNASPRAWVLENRAFSGLGPGRLLPFERAYNIPRASPSSRPSTAPVAATAPLAPLAPLENTQEIPRPLTPHSAALLARAKDEARPQRRREYVNLPVLNFDQKRQFNWVIIKGEKLQVDPKTSMLAGRIPDVAARGKLGWLKQMRLLFRMCQS